MEQNEKELTHWKRLTTTNYIGAYSMPTDGSNIVLTIKNVVREKVKGEGGKEEECTVAYFQEDSKPMILNRTNCKAISAAYKTPYIEEWAGCKVEITVANVKVAGEMMEALRILPKVPVNKKAELKKGSAAFTKVVEYIKGGGDIAKIKDKYEVSTETEKDIYAAAK
jgi:hypothetical protein